MKVTFKLYATLSEYLPSAARDHKIVLDVDNNATPNQLIDAHKVPRKMAHLVVLNGVYVQPGDRDKALHEGDTLAIWPPVAGG